MRTLTITAVLAVAATALTACGNLSFGTHEQKRSYDAPAGVTALKIKTNGSRVEITASDSPGIKVRERLRWSNSKNKPEARHVTEGGTLALSAKCATTVIGYNACGVAYRVQIPRSTPVEIDNQDGSISASGLAGTVKLHSDNGSITVTDLRASSASLSSDDGALRVSGHATTADLKSGNGSIDANDLTADRLTARSRDGRIRLSGHVKTTDVHTDNGSISANGLTTERINARTRDGGISLRFASTPADVRAVTDNGSIHVRVPDDQGYAISMSTDNGRKRVEPTIHIDSRSPNHMRLDTRDGGISVSAA